MKMYVVNCTQQVQDFVYRLPESSNVRSQPIAIGGIIQISGDINQPQIDSIVKQHARYGMVAEEDVDRTKPFIGLYFTVDRHPKMARVYDAITHNVEVLEARGRALRQDAAVVTTNAIEQNVPPGSLRELEMSVVEERRNGKDVDDPSIAEGFRVTRDHQGPPAPESRGEQRRRQRRRAA